MKWYHKEEVDKIAKTAIRNLYFAQFLDDGDFNHGHRMPYYYKKRVFEWSNRLETHMPDHFGDWCDGTKTQTIINALAGLNFTRFSAKVADLVSYYDDVKRKIQLLHFFSH